jgi:hypothetical protein
VHIPTLPMQYLRPCPPEADGFRRSDENTPTD